MNLLKQAQEIVIIQETANLFFSRSINEVTIKDIANKLGIGEATIYRHYNNKLNLVLRVAKYLQEEVLSKYFTFSQSGNGYTKIEQFYKSFLLIFKEHPSYFKFINEFDAFILNNNIGVIPSYEEGIDAFKNAFDELYKQGINDGSVNRVDNIDTFYFATTHSLMEVCKKLADKDVISQDAKLDKTGEVEVLIETILYRLKKNKK